MASDQLAIGGDKAGDGPAELGHAAGNPCHLVGVVGLGVSGVGTESGQRPCMDSPGYARNFIVHQGVLSLQSCIRPFHAVIDRWP